MLLENFWADVNLRIIIINFYAISVKALHSEASLFLSLHSVNEGKCTQGQYENRISIVYWMKLRMNWENTYIRSGIHVWMGFYRKCNNRKSNNCNAMRLLSGWFDCIKQ